jgi:crossover junction endodeoxyribonuclease RuvC
MSEAIRILGIDPGSQITGFGLIEWSAAKSVAVEWGCIQTSGEHSERLKAIFAGIGAIAAEYRPAEVAIERVFLHRNADSALKLGQARAAAICATFDCGAAVYEYSARHIKKAVVGSGAAEKDQVQHMVRTILGIRDALPSDAADALAAAVCHAHERRTATVIERAVGRA